MSVKQTPARKRCGHRCHRQQPWSRLIKKLARDITVSQLRT